MIVGVLLMVAAAAAGFNLNGFGTVWFPAVLSVVAFGIGHILYAKTLQHIEASAFSVLFATQAVWIMLAGVLLLGETLSFWQTIGTALIFVSLLISSDGTKHIRLDHGTILGLATGLIFGLAITSWSFAGRHMDVLSWTAISFIGTAMVVYLIKPSSTKHIQPLLATSVIPKLLVLGVLYGLGSLTMLYAYNAGTLAEVTPVRQTSIIVTTLLALLILKDERTRISTKLFAAAISFVGVVMIVM